MALHLYGVTTSDAAAPEVKGRQDRDVRTVSDERLAVIVSDVDADTPAGRKDLLAHAHVLEWYVERATVVPMRFGMALPDEDAVRQQLLSEERDELESMLGWFEGLVQVTVQAFHHEEPVLREVMRRHPELLRLRDELRSFPELQDKQVRLGQAVADALAELEEEDRGMILDRLAPLARAVADNEASSAHEVVHAAFLVERGDRAAFDEAVGALRRDHEATLRIRYVGPQPPYSFLDAVRNGELVWD